MSRIANADLYTTTTNRETIGYGSNSRPATVITHTTPCRRSRAFVELGADSVVAVCNRCGGDGWNASDLDDHRCWGCFTTGVQTRVMSRAQMDKITRTWALAKRRNEAKRASAAAARDIDLAAWRAGNAELITWAESLTPDEVYPATEWEDEYGVFGLYRNADQLVNNLRNGRKLNDRDAAFLSGVRDRHIADAAAALVSRHAGAVGDKLTITGVVKTAREIEQHFGYRTSYSNFVVVAGTGEHAGITWTMFTAAAGFGRLESGDAVTITATIKENGEYKGTKQDKVTRPKLITV